MSFDKDDKQFIEGVVAHAVDVLEQKMERNSQNLRADLFRYTDRRTNEILHAVNSAFNNLDESPSVRDLNERVEKLEATVFPTK